MELLGSVTIPAPPQQVWQALNNPEILRQCIPGCEEVQQISPEEINEHQRLWLLADSYPLKALIPVDQGFFHVAAL